MLPTATILRRDAGRNSRASGVAKVVPVPEEVLL
jgi:hypothetical protein